MKKDTHPLHISGEIQMVSMPGIILIGFILGMRHATDGDHVVAITTIVSKERSLLKAAFVGVVWGLGHTMTVFLVGSAIVFFGLSISPRLGLAMELTVAIMLVLLGALNLAGITRRIRNTLKPGTLRATEVDDGRLPENSRFSIQNRLKRMLRKMGGYRLLRPLIVGIVHGLAGSAAIALLLMATIRDPGWTVLYLLVFGLGTIAGMMLITAMIAVPFLSTAFRFEKLNHGMSTACALLSLCFGFFLAYRIGFVDGLFMGNAHWMPR